MDSSKTLHQSKDACQVYPETLYYAKRISEGGPQPVYKKLLPDGIPEKLPLAPSQRLRNHSPDGFQWGYGGSGPAQLALALLLDVTTSPDMAQAHYQDFKFYMVASWGEEWSITSMDILEWLKSEERRELQKATRFSQN